MEELLLTLSPSTSSVKNMYKKIQFTKVGKDFTIFSDPTESNQGSQEQEPKQNAEEFPQQLRLYKDQASLDEVTTKFWLSEQKIVEALYHDKKKLIFEEISKTSIPVSRMTRLMTQDMTPASTPSPFPPAVSVPCKKITREANAIMIFASHLMIKELSLKAYESSKQNKHKCIHLKNVIDAIFSDEVESFLQVFLLTKKQGIQIDPEIFPLSQMKIQKSEESARTSDLVITKTSKAEKRKSMKRGQNINNDDRELKKKKGDLLSEELYGKSPNRQWDNVAELPSLDDNNADNSLCYNSIISLAGSLPCQNLQCSSSVPKDPLQLLSSLGVNFGRFPFLAEQVDAKYHNTGITTTTPTLMEPSSSIDINEEAPSHSILSSPEVFLSEARTEEYQRDINFKEYVDLNNDENLTLACVSAETKAYLSDVDGENLSRNFIESYDEIKEYLNDLHGEKLSTNFESSDETKEYLNDLHGEKVSKHFIERYGTEEQIRTPVFPKAWEEVSFNLLEAEEKENKSNDRFEDYLFSSFNISDEISVAKEEEQEETYHLSDSLNSKTTVQESDYDSATDNLEFDLTNILWA